MDPSGRDGVANLDLDFDEQEPDRNRLQAADALVLTDPERALREYQDLANLGSAMSLLALGLMYERGQGTVLDVSKSFEYYALASEKGSVRATFNLGRLYYNQHDFAKSEELLSVGVSKNDPRAMYWLARLYLATSLHGLEKIDEALVLLRQAMLVGHIQSGRKLGRMLMSGHYGYSKILKGVFYFCSCTFRGIVIFVKNPSSEFLLDSHTMERMKQLRPGCFG